MVICVCSVLDWIWLDGLTGWLDSVCRYPPPPTHTHIPTPKIQQLAALQERVAQMEDRDRLQRSVNVRCRAVDSLLSGGGGGCVCVCTKATDGDSHDHYKSIRTVSSSRWSGSGGRPARRRRATRRRSTPSRRCSRSSRTSSSACVHCMRLVSLVGWVVGACGDTQVDGSFIYTSHIPFYPTPPLSFV